MLRTGLQITVNYSDSKSKENRRVMGGSSYTLHSTIDYQYLITLKEDNTAIDVSVRLINRAKAHNQKRKMK